MYRHPPSPGQADMRGFQWLVTGPDIRLTTSAQESPQVTTRSITPVTSTTLLIARDQSTI